MATTGQSRRKFIITLIGLLATGGFLRRYLSAAPPAKKVLLSVARDEIPSRGALVYRQSRVALIRQDDGIIALSLVCTHLGCTVAVTAEELVCPCHGSIFDRQGRVVKGPADRPLERLSVQEKDGRILVMAGV
jgi:cytochrome b6-f complex iron-sulfur subunit